MKEERTQELRISQIRIDGGTQMRAGLNPATVEEYAEVIRLQERAGNWPFPPLVVYHDGESYWLGDGFHRLAALRKVFRYDEGNQKITHMVPAIIHAGNRRDAILHAAGANSDHGLRRTNADKRRAVDVLLRDEEWGKWSDREIARRCHVSDRMVNGLRSELSANNSQIATERTVQRGDAVYTMNTSGQRESAQARNADSRSTRLVQKFGWGFSHSPQPPHGDGRVMANMPCGLGTLGTFDDHDAALDAAEAAQKSRAIPVDLPARLVGTCLVVSDGVRYHAQAHGGGKGPRWRTFDSIEQAIAWLEAESGLLVSPSPDKAAQEAQPSYVSVWVLERAVSNALDGFWRADEEPDIAGNLRALMTLREWEEVRLGKAIMGAVGNLVYRKRDLVQAINNVRGQAEQGLRVRDQGPNTDRPAINLPADLVTAAAGRCSIRPFGNEFMAKYVDLRGGINQAHFPTTDEAIAWLRKKANGPGPSPLAAHLDHTDQVLAAEVAAMLADDAPANEDEPPAHPAHVARSEAILAEVLFWRDASNRLEKVGELTGQHTVALPLRRAIEEIVRVLSKELVA